MDKPVEMPWHVYEALEKAYSVLKSKQNIADMTQDEFIYVTTKLESIIDQFRPIDPNEVAPYDENRGLIDDIKDRVFKK